MTDPHDDWNERERAQLAALEATESPPAELEARVLASLRERGLIRPDRPRVAWRAAAAVVAALTLGVVLGRSITTPGRPSPPPPRTFLLLLYPGTGLDPSPEAEAARVREYGQWARGLAAQGRMDRGEKLKDGARVFGDTLPTSAEALQGFFLIRAGSIEEAEEIARTCPHRGHGGTIALREVDPT